MEARRKLAFTSVGVLLLLLLSFQLAFRKSMEQRKRLRVLQTQITQMRTAPAAIERLQRQNAALQLPGQLARYDREVLFGLVASLCREHDLLLRAFPPPQAENHDRLRLVVSEIQLEGAYQDMLRLAFALERTHGAGQLAGASFHLQQDPLTRRKSLNGTIYLQNVCSYEDQ